jgi:hypothetical protein
LLAARALERLEVWRAALASPEPVAPVAAFATQGA